MPVFSKSGGSRLFSPMKWKSGPRAVPEDDEGGNFSWKQKQVAQWHMFDKRASILSFGSVIPGRPKKKYGQ